MKKTTVLYLYAGLALLVLVGLSIAIFYFIGQKQRPSASARNEAISEKRDSGKPPPDREGIHPALREESQPQSRDEKNIPARLRDDKKRALQVLQSLTEHDDPAIAQIGAEFLSRTKNKAAVRILLEILADPNNPLQIRAAMGLAQMGDARGVELLHTLLERGPSWPLRLQIAQALVYLGEPEGEEIFIEALQLEDWVLRLQATVYWGECGDRTALSHLAPLLDDPTISVRINVAASMALLGDEGVLTFLEDSLDHFNYAVQNIAAKALAMLGHQEAAPFFEQEFNSEEPFVRMHGSRFLALLGDFRGLPVLEAGLNDSNPHMRAYAAESLLIIEAAPR